jgi:hypothetical protein
MVGCRRENGRAWLDFSVELVKKYLRRAASHQGTTAIHKIDTDLRVNDRSN